MVFIPPLLPFERCICALLTPQPVYNGLCLRSIDLYRFRHSFILEPFKIVHIVYCSILHNKSCCNRRDFERWRCAKVDGADASAQGPRLNAMTTFDRNRDLLNPKFESYKLLPLTQEEHVYRHLLTYRPTQANVSGRSRTPLSFEEVQSRIRHNHLSVAQDGQSALYVDENFNIVRVSVTQVRIANRHTPAFGTDH